MPRTPKRSSTSSFVQRWLTFLTVGVCVAFCVDRLLLVGWRTRKIGEPGIINRVCRGQASADIVITGSSRALYCVDCDVIERATGLRCLNLGMDGSHIDEQIAFLRLYFDKNRPPKYLVHCLDDHSVTVRDTVFNDFRYVPYLDETVVYEFARSEELRFVPYRWIPLYGCAKLGPRYTLSALCSLIGLEYNRSMRQPNGYEPVDESWDGSFEEARRQFPEGIEVEVQSAAVSALVDLFHLAKTHGTRMFLVYPPVYRESQGFIKNRSQVQTHFQRFAEETETPYLDFSGHWLCERKEFFYNSQHLNGRGASQFTEALLDEPCLADLGATQSSNTAWANAAWSSNPSAAKP